jgi:DNA repair protein RadC
MANLFSKYKLELVKESTLQYQDVVDFSANNPSAVNEVLNALKLRQNTEEVLILISLDNKNKVVGAFEVSRGSLSSSVVHPREVFKRAILLNASSVIVAHNHPSGVPEPSKEDISITKRLLDVGKLVGIDLLDHIIVGDNDKFVSLKERGVI